MKYFIIAGEASGDLHGSNLIKALQEKDPQSVFVGLGGDKMRDAGCSILVDYRDMAYMGFIAVIQNIGKVQRNLKIAKQSLLKEKPDVLILIDYPSFNLRIAKYCRRQLPHTRIIYYIPPKIWAWKEWRVHQMAKYTDDILGIFPFEPYFYARHGYTCQYVGNPTADSIREWKETHINGSKQESPATIALLPGSRRSEISHCLPIMLNAARRVAKDTYHIRIAAAPGIDDNFYRPFIREGETITRDTYTLVANAHAAVVNSGTATLETALIGCPQTAVYHVAGSKYLEWLIKPILFKIKHFTLVNIIAKKEVIQELVGQRFTQENIEKELYKLLNDNAYRQQIRLDYADIQASLGTESAAINAANIITKQHLSQQ